MSQRRPTMGTGNTVAASCSIFFILQGISQEMGLKIGPMCAAIYWLEYPLTKRTKVCVMAMNHFSKTVLCVNPAASVWQLASSFDHWRYSKSKHFGTLSALGRRGTHENFHTGLSLYAMRFGLDSKTWPSLLGLWNKDSTCVGLITLSLLIHC